MTYVLYEKENTHMDGHSKRRINLQYVYRSYHDN